MKIKYHRWVDETTEIYFLTVQEAGNLRSKCPQSRFLVRISSWLVHSHLSPVCSHGFPSERESALWYLFLSGHLLASLVAQVVKNLPANAGDTSSIPGSGRSPGEENGSLLEYACLDNSADRGAWEATVHGVARVGHD